MAQTPLDVMHAFYEAHNNQDFDAIVAMLDEEIIEDYVYDEPDNITEGKQAWIEKKKIWYDSIEFHFEIEQGFVHENTVIALVIGNGTFLSDIPGYPPVKGKSYTFGAVDILEMDNGKIKKWTNYQDKLPTLVQLEIIEAPPAPELVPSFELPGPEPVTGLSPTEMWGKFIIDVNNHDIISFAKIHAVSVEYYTAANPGVAMNRSQLIATQEQTYAMYPDIQYETTRLLDLGNGWIFTEHNNIASLPSGSKPDKPLRSCNIVRYENGLVTYVSTYSDMMTVINAISQSSVSCWELMK